MDTVPYDCETSFISNLDPSAFFKKMSPEETESTPLLFNSSAHSSQNADSDDDTVSSVSLRELHSHTRLTTSYRRPSFAQAGGRGLLLSSSPVPESALRDDETFDIIREERGLLKRCSIIGVPGGQGRRSRRGSFVANVVADVEETWDDAVKAGKITTSWRYELGVMMRYSVIFPPKE